MVKDTIRYYEGYMYQEGKRRNGRITEGVLEVWCLETMEEGCIT
jgi:hypothetical protein